MQRVILLERVKHGSYLDVYACLMCISQRVSFKTHVFQISNKRVQFYNRDITENIWHTAGQRRI